MFQTLIMCASWSDAGIVFITEPNNIEVVLTTHTVAQFSCQYRGGRENETKLEWIINSKRYQLTNLPTNHVVLENGNTLYVTNITSKDNNSFYQCQILAGDREKQNQCAYRSKIGKLTISSNGKSWSYM